MFRTISGRTRIKRIIILFFSVIVCIYLLAPIYWVVVSSFQKEIELTARPPHFIPKPGILTLNHYHFLVTGEIPEKSTLMLQSTYVMSGTEVFPAMVNSIVIALFVTLINVVLGFPAGHAFARFRFWADRQMLLTMLATRLLPSISILIPAFILLRAAGLLDTRLALVAFYSAMTLPFTIWIMRAYFRNIRMEFEEAARIDGCGYLRMMMRVVVPLAKPGLIAAAIFTFMYSYAEFILATILTQTTRSRTLTAVMAHLSIGDKTASRGMVTASATIAIIPPILVVIIFRRQILEGLTARLGL